MTPAQLKLLRVLVDRRRREVVGAPPPEREWWHGTENGYKRHACRCDDCRRATAEGRRRRRLNNPTVAVHNASGYGNGCRCDDCRRAQRYKQSEWRYDRKRAA